MAGLRGGEYSFLKLIALANQTKHRIKSISPAMLNNKATQAKLESSIYLATQTKQGN
jgi:hypothetical protein